MSSNPCMDINSSDNIKLLLGQVLFYGNMHMHFSISNSYVKTSIWHLPLLAGTMAGSFQTGIGKRYSLSLLYRSERYIQTIPLIWQVVTFHQFANLYSLYKRNVEITQGSRSLPYSKNETTVQYYLSFLVLGGVETISWLCSVFDSLLAVRWCFCSHI